MRDRKQRKKTGKRPCYDLGRVKALLDKGVYRFGCKARKERKRLGFVTDDEAVLFIKEFICEGCFQKSVKYERLDGGWGPGHDVYVVPDKGRGMKLYIKFFVQDTGEVWITSITERDNEEN